MLLLLLSLSLFVILLLFVIIVVVNLEAQGLEWQRTEFRDVAEGHRRSPRRVRWGSWAYVSIVAAYPVLFLEASCLSHARCCFAAAITTGATMATTKSTATARNSHGC